MPIVSIIMTHWGMNDFRSETMRRCLESIITTTNHVQAEIIVVDNGFNLEDSKYLLELAQNKKIQFYVRNSENLYFGYARNQGLALSCGEYLVFTDNDIEYRRGWIELGLDLLEAYPGEKLAFTPLRADRTHRNVHYWRGNIIHRDTTYLTNSRAGSNSWLIRRKDWKIEQHPVPQNIASYEFRLVGDMTSKDKIIVGLDLRPKA